jgi:hypothetical protein
LETSHEEAPRTLLAQIAACFAGEMSANTGHARNMLMNKAAARRMR